MARRPPLRHYRHLVDGLPGMTTRRAALRALAETMRDRIRGAPAGDSPASDGRPAIPAAYTYLGQFATHDVTFDDSPLGRRRRSLDSLRNHRSPAYDLDTVYGHAERPPDEYLETDQHGRLVLFRLGTTSPSEDGGIPVMPGYDLPRDPSTGRARFPSTNCRNDDFLVTAQLHLAVLRFHNRVASDLAGSPDEVFAEARRITTWHYQHVILNDWLPRIVRHDQWERTVEDGPLAFDTTDGPWIPVEFSAAGERFGHSMVRERYDFNRNLTEPFFARIRERTGGGGKVPVGSDWIVEWPRLLHPDAGRSAVASRRLNPYLSLPLHTLDTGRGVIDLAFHTLMRGRAYSLPSAQDLAGELGVPVMEPYQLAFGFADEVKVIQRRGFDTQTPLWFYMLKEAQVLENGVRLGPLGSRVLCEVVVGMLRCDADSYLNNEPGWQPTHGADLTAFLRFAHDDNLDPYA